MAIDLKQVLPEMDVDVGKNVNMMHENVPVSDANKKSA